jgi:NAD(P)-dependent dehydrogenase (short-subunit alcohol dehydrogenase family)
MRTIAVTGAASGIGAALSAQLLSAGDRVITVDSQGGDVVCDLGDPDGRAQAIEEVTKLSGGVLDGFVAAAGVGPTNRPPQRLVAVNFFGAVSLLDAMRPLLLGGTNPSAVAVTSNTVTCHQNPVPMHVVDACRELPESEALETVATASSVLAYPIGKLALSRWVRQRATTEDWIGSGIRLNLVAPGSTETAMLAERFEDANLADAAREFPNPLGRFLSADEVANVIAFVLSAQASSMCGSLVFCDGGVDAYFHAEDVPAPFLAG